LETSPLTNFEVIDFLKSKGASKHPTDLVPSELKVYEYLVETAANNQKKQNILEFKEKSEKYGLARAKVINIINTRPTTQVELYPLSESRAWYPKKLSCIVTSPRDPYKIIEDEDYEHLGHDLIKELCGMVAEVFPSPPTETASKEGNIETKVTNETNCEIGNKEKNGGGGINEGKAPRVQFVRMDKMVDTLNNAYQEFVGAAANVLEAKESSVAQKTLSTDAALENFKQKWELFRVACDQAEEFVESVKQRIGSECLVDEATGSVAGKSGGSGNTLAAAATGLPRISAVRLEQMSKAVRWLVIELQHGSGSSAGSAAHSHPSAAPFDARFTEDSAQ
ncbi:RNA polymerase II, Rpb, partial [Trema orientale]